MLDDVTAIVDRIVKGVLAVLGNAFKDACRKAGITNRSAHGLRKIAAARLAERGATEAELDAIFGWTGGRMASLYTRSANRRRLAIEAMHKLGTEQEKKRPPTEAALGHRAQPNNGVGQRAIDIRLAQPVSGITESSALSTR